MTAIGPRPPVSIVVPTRDRADRLPRLVAALEAQTLAPSTVVIVDDGSRDATPDVLTGLERATSLPLRVVRLEASQGPAAARNIGWQSTDAEVVAFTDDDCEPSPGWLAAGVDTLLAHPRAGVVQGRTLPQAGVERRDWFATREVLRPSPFFEGCNLFLRRAALEETSGFDEDLRMGAEDTALGWEVLDRGWGRAFATDALVHHDVTHPGMGWHVRQAYMEGNLVGVAVRHPGLRETFWRPWAFRSRGAAFAAAAVGLGLSRWKRPAVALVLPYLWINRPSRPYRAWLRAQVDVAVIDGASFVGMVRGSLRHRTLIV